MFIACSIDKTCDEVFDIHFENEDSEDSPVILVIKAKEEKYQKFTRMLTNVLASVHTKEFMC
jgi:hypothetical protein